MAQKGRHISSIPRAASPVGLGHNILAHDEGRDKTAACPVRERLREWCSCPVVGGSPMGQMGKSRVHAMEGRNNPVGGTEPTMCSSLKCWGDGAMTISAWRRARAVNTLSNPSVVPISIGMHSQLLQSDGVPVPPETVWEAALRSGEAHLHLPALWKEVQIQGRT